MKLRLLSGHECGSLLCINGVMSKATQKQDDYNLYLKSAVWRKKRTRVLNRDEHACQICGSNEKLQVHHLTYERVFWEFLEDLMTLCEACHTDWHKKNPKPKRKRQRGKNRPDGICRTCRTKMTRPYWAPGGGFYCSIPCKTVGKAAVKAERRRLQKVGEARNAAIRAAGGNPRARRNYTRSSNA